MTWNSVAYTKVGIINIFIYVDILFIKKTKQILLSYKEVFVMSNYFSQNEIQSLNERLNSFILSGDHNGIFQTSLQLESTGSLLGAYWLGSCYLNGWGTQIDNNLGAKYCEKATACDIPSIKPYAYYNAGVGYYRLGEYDDAIQLLQYAESLNVAMATVFIADAYAALAFCNWDIVRNIRTQNDMADGLTIIKVCINNAQDKYLEAATEHPETMTPAFWCGFGNVGVLYYNLATQGLLNVERIDETSLIDYFFAGANMVSEKWNTEKQETVYNIGVLSCEVMEDCGAEFIAEYYRAYLSLLDSERNKSAEAFYRARWHLKKVGELRSVVGEAVANEVAGYLTDVDVKFKALDKKYGGIVHSMMRSGRFPNLQPSYFNIEVPPVESCRKFMDMFYEVRSAGNTVQQPASNAPSKEKKGFFSKLFK